MDYKDFFSVDASELNLGNKWSKDYLTTRYRGNILTEINEYIAIQRKHTFYWDLADENLFYKYLSGEVSFIKHGKSPEFSESKNIDHVDQSNYFKFKRRTEDELFAIYNSGNSKIEYYQGFYEAPNEIKQIVTIHERMHAYHHIGWSEFPDVSVVYKEFLAQLFTFKVIEGSYLMSYFKELSTKQPHIYQTWILSESLNYKEVMDLLFRIKNTKTSNLPFLDTLAREYRWDPTDEYVRIALDDMF